MQLPLFRRARGAALAAAVSAALAAAALPAAAQAGTVSMAGGTLVYADTTSRGEQNNVLMRSSGGRVVIRDDAGVASDTSACRVIAGALDCASPERVQVILGRGFDSIEYRLPHGGIVQLGEDNDTVVAGTREADGRIIQPVTYSGDSGYDLVSYHKAIAGVSVDMADGLANDGRIGERENVLPFEALTGSNLRDTLFGTPARDDINGGLERDLIAGGGGNDVFHSSQRDGADDYHGGPGIDTIEYFGRTQPLSVTLDNITNDGESGEFDLVRSNVENVNGGAGADTLNSFSAVSRLEGRAGADTLIGGSGADTLVPGAGRDSVDAGGENDVVDAVDGEPDAVDCGTGTDRLSVDATEGRLRGCESALVGVLRLAPKVVDASVDTPVRVGLNWRHPKSWRNLRSVVLRAYKDGGEVGAVVIRPRGERLSAAGAFELVRGGTRVSVRGKVARARLVLRVDASMAGERLRLEVEATDVRGRRQLETGAGAIRVAR